MMKKRCFVFATLFFLSFRAHALPTFDDLKDGYTAHVLEEVQVARALLKNLEMFLKGLEHFRGDAEGSKITRESVDKALERGGYLKLFLLACRNEHGTGFLKQRICKDFQRCFEGESLEMFDQLDRKWEFLRDIISEDVCDLERLKRGLNGCYAILKKFENKFHEVIFAREAFLGGSNDEITHRLGLCINSRLDLIHEWLDASKESLDASSRAVTSIEAFARAKLFYKGASFYHVLGDLVDIAEMMMLNIPRLPEDKQEEIQFHLEKITQNLKMLCDLRMCLENSWVYKRRYDTQDLRTRDYFINPHVFKMFELSLFNIKGLSFEGLYEDVSVQEDFIVYTVGRLREELLFLKKDTSAKDAEFTFIFHPEILKRWMKIFKDDIDSFVLVYARCAAAFYENPSLYNLHYIKEDLHFLSFPPQDLNRVFLVNALPKMLFGIAETFRHFSKFFIDDSLVSE